MTKPPSEAAFLWARYMHPWRKYSYKQTPQVQAQSYYDPKIWGQPEPDRHSDEPPLMDFRRWDESGWSGDKRHG